MEYINFEDFQKQCESSGVYGVINIIIEWLNYQNLTYDLFAELVRRYSQMEPGQRELYKLPFSPGDM